MTNEKLLEIAYTIAQNHNPQLYERFRRNPADFIGNAYDPVLDAAAVLIMDARAGMDKKSGNGGKLAAAKRIIKLAQRDTLRGGWTDAGGRFVLCSGFHGVRLAEPLNGVQATKGMDIARAFVDNGGDVLTLPTIPELKSVVVAWKADGKPQPGALYDFGDGLPQVRAEYLIDILTLLPGATAKARGELSPLYFESDDGDGVLCPVRKVGRA